MLEGRTWDVRRLLGAEMVRDCVSWLNQNDMYRARAIESRENAEGDGEGATARENATGDATDDDRVEADADVAQYRPRAPPPRPAKL